MRKSKGSCFANTHNYSFVEGQQKQNVFRISPITLFIVTTKDSPLTLDICASFFLYSWTFRGRPREPSQISPREILPSSPRTSMTPNQIDGTQGKDISCFIIWISQFRNSLWSALSCQAFFEPWIVITETSSSHILKLTQRQHYCIFVSSLTLALKLRMFPAVESVVCRRGVTESCGEEVMSTSADTKVTWSWKRVTTNLSAPSLL